MTKYVILASAVFVLSAAAQNLPDGAGKDAFTGVCSGCHALDLATSQKKPRAGWQATVDSMVAKGATASKEQLDAIVEYLAAHFGPDDAPSLNAAAAGVAAGADAGVPAGSRTSHTSTSGPG